MGDQIRQADGTTGMVWQKRNLYQTQEMYNLTVNTAHTYFVGDGQWLVHNACRPDPTETTGGVYRLIDPNTGATVRTGRTNDLSRRMIEHKRDPSLQRYDFESVYKTNDYAEQRGLEQVLHDTYNPPLNRIRPISPNNRKIGLYMRKARKYLGME